MVQVVDVVLVENNKVLLVQQLKASAKGLWSYPGGQVEHGETLHKALLREIKEELGLRLTNIIKFKEYSIVTKKGPLQITTFTGSIGNQQIRIKKDELICYGWFSLNELESMSESLRGPVVLQQAKEVLAKTTGRG